MASRRPRLRRSVTRKERPCIHCSDPGLLTATYRARIRLGAVEPSGPADHIAAVGVEGRQSYERQVYLRPSRYCPSDHLVGFASSEFGTDPDIERRFCRIAEWIGPDDVPGSGHCARSFRRKTRFSPAREHVVTSLTSGLPSAGPPESLLDLQRSAPGLPSDGLPRRV